MPKFKVKLRRGDKFKVKPECEQIDGKVYEFTYGWIIEKSDSKLYAGETAWLCYDENYPLKGWMASGDLIPVAEFDYDGDLPIISGWISKPIIPYNEKTRAILAIWAKTLGTIETVENEDGTFTHTIK